MGLGGTSFFVRLLNRIAVPTTRIKPNKQLTAVMMIDSLLIDVLLC